MSSEEDLADERAIVDVETWLTEARPTAAPLAVVLLFQVNCPGCFLHALPALVAVRERFEAAVLSVAAVATAFEDTEFNTLDNARALVRDGTLVGETRRVFYQKFGKETLSRGDLDLGAIPVAWDRLTSTTAMAPADREALLDKQASKLLRALKQHAASGELALSDDQARAALRDSLRRRAHFAATFDGNAVLGTPSWLVYDPRTMRLVDKFFGETTPDELEALVRRSLPPGSRDHHPGSAAE